MQKKEYNRNSLNGNTTAMLITCMGIAVLLWVANKFTQEYNTTISGEIRYTNTPNNLLISRNTTKEIQLLVKTKGFNILLNKILKSNFIIDIEYNLLSQKANYILSDNLSNQIGIKLPNGIQLIDVFPDTLHYYFDKSFSKLVPIFFKKNITFQAQFGMAEAIAISPSKVQLTGVKSDVISIVSVETENINYKNLNTSKTGKVKLKNIPGISFNLNEISYTIPVEEYTEKEIEVSISKINLTNKNRVEVYPKKIKLQCMVSLKNYEKVKPELFEATADFAAVDIKQENKVAVTISRMPAFVKNINFLPKKVDFILYK